MPAGPTLLRMLGTLLLVLVSALPGRAAEPPRPIRVGIIGMDAHALPWTKIVNNPVAVPGEPLIYTVTVTNSGPSDASGVTIGEDLTLPAGVTRVSVVPSWSFTGARPPRRACRSVFPAMNSIPLMSQAIMRLTALPPPPPTIQTGPGACRTSAPRCSTATA